MVAAFLVAAGVVIEFGGDWLARPYERIVAEGRQSQIAALSAESDTARSEIAKANASAAAANERAANLEREAAAANERAAEIMKATAWRQFQSDQVNRLRQSLSAHPGKVIVAWIANDSESFALAAQFLEILKDAKWDVSTSARTYAGSLVFGIWVPDAEGAQLSTAALRNALSEAGHPAATGTLPPESMSFSQQGGADFATILFGSKKPTFAQPP